MKKLLLALIGSILASLLLMGCGGGEKAPTEAQMTSEAEKNASTMRSDSEKMAAEAEAKAQEMAKKAEAEAKKAMEDLKKK